MISKTRAQGTDGSRVMRFYATFRTSHCTSGLIHIKFFPHAKQKGLLLTERERLESRLQGTRALSLRHLLVGTRGFLIRHRLERIAVLLPVLATEPLAPLAPNSYPPIPVSYLALQDPMEERSPFLLVPRGIPLGKFEHRFLYQIEGFIHIAGCDLSHAEGTLFDSDQKPLKRLGPIQRLPPPRK